MVAGVPIGDDEFVRVHVDATVSSAEGKCKLVTAMLDGDCAHTLHTLNIRCLQPVLTYWTMHVYPSDMLRTDGDGSNPSKRMDDALLEVAVKTTGASYLRDERLAQRRLRLPAREKGGGLRSHESNTQAAFACTIAKVAPRLVRSKDENGTVRTGFLEQLAGEVFGTGHFDSDNQGDLQWGGEGRFAEFLAPGDNAF